MSNASSSLRVILFLLKISINSRTTPDSRLKLCFEIFPHIFINSILLIDKFVFRSIEGSQIFLIRTSFSSQSINSLVDRVKLFIELFLLKFGNLQID